jgi:hypothetical protein
MVQHQDKLLHSFSKVQANCTVDNIFCNSFYGFVDGNYISWSNALCTCVALTKQHGQLTLLGF